MSQWSRAPFETCILSCRPPDLSRISKLLTLQTQIVSLCTLRDCPHVSTARWILEVFCPAYSTALQTEFNCLQYPQPLNHKNTVSRFDFRVTLWPFVPLLSYGDHTSTYGLPISSLSALYVVPLVSPDLLPFSCGLSYSRGRCHITQNLLWYISLYFHRHDNPLICIFKKSILRIFQICIL